MFYNIFFIKSVVVVVSWHTHTQMRKRNSPKVWHIIVLAYENKFNLEAAYENVYARRAQTVWADGGGGQLEKQHRIAGKINVT